VPAQQLSEPAHVLLRAQDVIARLRVARLGQPCQRVDAGVLRELVLAHAARHLGLEEGVLVRQPVARELELHLRAHARQHHRGPQRLGDVVDRAHRQPALFLLGGVERGDADHRDVARQRIGAQAAHHLEAVHAGHHQVEQDQIGLRLQRSQLERRRAGIGRAHRVVAHQQFAQHREVLGDVIDDEHGRRQHRPTPPWPRAQLTTTGHRSASAAGSMIVRRAAQRTRGIPVQFAQK
jgi:hypothetical protein